MRRRVVLGLALAVAMTVTACGGDDEGLSQEETDRLVEAMVSEGGDEAEARCLVDELGADAERLFGAEQEDLSEDDTARALEVLADCREGDG